MVGKYIKDSTLINERFACDFINLGTASSLTEIGKGGLEKITRIIHILFSVFKYLAENRYSLCYMTLTARGAGFYKDVLVVLLLKLANQNIIYHFHNKGISENSKGFLSKTLYHFVFKNTKSILLSPHLYKDLAQYVKSTDAFYCPNGIPNDVYSIPGNKNNPTCKLIFLSNMMEQKGVYVLLDACNFLKKKGLLFQCDFVGGWSDISQKQFANKVRELELEDVVIAHGPKYGKEKQHFFQLADIFVLPTFYDNECFPLVLLEAMQNGLPVISTPEGGILDIVIDNETGFLVSQNDPVLLANRIEELIKNPSLRCEMGNKSRKRFEDHFTLEHFENNLIEILESAGKK